MGAIQAAMSHWEYIAPVLAVPNNEDDYNKLVDDLDFVLDALKFLMEEHNLKQSELPEVGSQGVVSEVLSGKRSLNVEQIKKLSDRFQVSIAVFI